MTVSTINYTLSEEDGWTSVATNPSYIYVRCNHNSPFYVYVSPTAPSLNGAQASGTITFTGAPVADETFVVGATTYTFKAAAGAANTIKIGANVTETAENVVAAINAAAGAGTLYGTGTVTNASASASNAAGVVTVLARVAGTAGNSIVLTESATNTTVSGSGTLAGGAAATGEGALFHPHKEGVMHYEKTGSTTAQVYIRTKSPYDVVFSVIRDQ